MLSHLKAQLCHHFGSFGCPLQLANVQAHWLLSHGGLCSGGLFRLHQEQYCRSPQPKRRLNNLERVSDMDGTADGWSWVLEGGASPLSGASGSENPNSTCRSSPMCNPSQWPSGFPNETSKRSVAALLGWMRSGFQKTGVVQPGAPGLRIVNDLPGGSNKVSWCQFPIAS